MSIPVRNCSIMTLHEKTKSPVPDLDRVEVHLCDDPVSHGHEGVPYDVPLGLGVRGPAQQHGLAHPLPPIHLILTQVVGY